jgi:hypothetical protein
VRKKRILWVGVGVIALGTVWFGFLRPRDEPKSQGRYLSEWIVDSYAPNSTPSQRAASRLAIQDIGTNGLPYYLKWMRYEQPAWQQSLRWKLPHWIKSNPTVDHWLYAGERRADWSISKVASLGTNAVSTIPELEAMMNDHTKPGLVSRAITALGNLGGPAIPALQRSLADPNQNQRYQIVLYLGTIARQGHTNDCLPILMEVLNDQDAAVRSAATNAVLQFAPELLPNVPTDRFSGRDWF